MNENTSIMGCIIPHNLPISYMYKMLQLQEHNYLAVIISLVFVIFLKAAILKMAHITDSAS